jgi:hypothetical protein
MDSYEGKKVAGFSYGHLTKIKFVGSPASPACLVLGAIYHHIKDVTNFVNLITYNQLIILQPGTNELIYTTFYAQ